MTAPAAAKGLPRTVADLNIQLGNLAASIGTVGSAGSPGTVADRLAAVEELALTLAATLLDDPQWTRATGPVRKASGRA